MQEKVVGKADLTGWTVRFLVLVRDLILLQGQCKIHFCGRQPANIMFCIVSVAPLQRNFKLYGIKLVRNTNTSYYKQARILATAPNTPVRNVLHAFQPIH